MEPMTTTMTPKNPYIPVRTSRFFHPSHARLCCCDLWPWKTAVICSRTLASSLALTRLRFSTLAAVRKLRAACRRVATAPWASWRSKVTTTVMPPMMSHSHECSGVCICFVIWLSYNLYFVCNLEFYNSKSACIWLVLNLRTRFLFPFGKIVIEIIIKWQPVCIDWF